MSMYPPIFALCKADSGVTALIGSSPCRLYKFGEARQNTPKPYAVWQNVGGGPGNYISGRPDSDLFSIQIDVYGDTSEIVEQVGQAISEAVELSAHVVGWYGTTRDVETRNYRFSFGVDFLVDR